jgi:hypothetical protein
MFKLPYHYLTSSLNSRSIEMVLRSINEKAEINLEIGRGTSSFFFYFSLLDRLTVGDFIKHIF